MLNNDFLKKINTYKILMYSIICKYLFCYILVFYGHRIKIINILFNSKSGDIPTTTSFSLLLLFFLTLINIILILLNNYNFNKVNNNVENSENIEILNKIKKINKFEFITIIFFVFISFITIFISLKLNSRSLNDLGLFFLTIILGIFPISILEILYYYEKKRENIIKTNDYIEK